ncbi:hypothetical protein ACM66B_005380 [Microbotryomycetes sp. NB124-2]
MATVPMIPTKRLSSPAPTETDDCAGEADRVQVEPVERPLHDTNRSAVRPSDESKTSTTSNEGTLTRQDAPASQTQPSSSSKPTAPSSELTTTQEPKFKKRQRVKRKEMPDIWAQSLENVLEDQPGIEAVMTLEGMLDPVYITRPHHVRQLFALCLDPTSCGFVRRKSNKQSVQDHDKDALDPLVETTTKVRLTSLKTLQQVAYVNGTRTLFRAIRGHGYVKDEFDDKQTRERGHGPAAAEWDKVWDDPVDVEDDQDESKIAEAGRVVGKCRDVWELMQVGMEGKVGARKHGRLQDPLCFGGWDLLDALCSIWEREMEERELNDCPPVSPTLLSTLDLADETTRRLPHNIVDIVFWPFSSSSVADDPLTAPPSGETSRAGTAFGERADTEEAAQLRDGLNEQLDKTTEKQRISVRLLSLLGAHILRGHIERSSMSQLLVNLREMSVDALATLLEHLPRQQTHSALFNVRLLEMYLDTSSHSSGSKNKSNHAGQHLSPRKSGLLSRPSSSMINVEPATPRKALAATTLPRDYHKTLSVYMAKLPLELPIKLIVSAELEPAQPRKPARTNAASASAVVDLTVSSPPTVANSSMTTSSPLPSLPTLLHQNRSTQSATVKPDIDLRDLVIDSDPSSSSMMMTTPRTPKDLVIPTSEDGDDVIVLDSASPLVVVAASTTRDYVGKDKMLAAYDRACEKQSLVKASLIECLVVFLEPHAKWEVDRSNGELWNWQTALLYHVQQTANEGREVKRVEEVVRKVRQSLFGLAA